MGLESRRTARLRRLRVDVVLASEFPETGEAIRIALFCGMDHHLHLGRFPRLHGHAKLGRAVGLDLDSAGVETRLDEPAPRPIERLRMGELMGHVSHDHPPFICPGSDVPTEPDRAVYRRDATA